MSALADSEEWRVVKNFIEQKQVALAQDLRKNVGTASAEEIGMRFMVTDLANQVLSQLVAFVESANNVREYQREEALRDQGNKGKN